MKFLDEVSEQNVTERRFELEAGGERIPGILWHPTGAKGPRQLLLQGHGGTQHKRVQNILSLARRMVRHHGYAVAAIDAPAHGDRMTPEDTEAQRERRRAGGGVPRLDALSEEQRAQMAKRSQKAVGEWKTTLDALQRIDYVGDQHPVGYWGVSMGTAIGVPFVAAEPRIKCAILGLLGTRPGADELAQAAKRIEVPLLFMFQLNDELMPPEAGLALFDAFGSKIKSMHINPGPHVGIPNFERDYFETFYARHLGSTISK
jgi:dienelactone hydrolase